LTLIPEKLICAGMSEPTNLEINTPWYGLGRQVGSDLETQEILKIAGLNWNVCLSPSYFQRPGDTKIYENPNQCILYKDTPEPKVLSVTSPRWIPFQNKEAINFFRALCWNTKTELEIVGSLKGDRLIWGLARGPWIIRVGADRLSGWLLFTSSHEYGKNAEVRLVLLNEATMSTFVTWALCKFKNPREVDPVDSSDKICRLANAAVKQFREDFQVLHHERIREARPLVTFLSQVFPSTGRDRTALSAPAQEVIDEAMGSPNWWDALVSVTKVVDFKLGIRAETRLMSAWFGVNRTRKERAIMLALKFAQSPALQKVS
jgi:hypothetical protein